MFILLASVVTLLMSLILVAVLVVSNSYMDLHETAQSRYQSYLLADELRQTSDDLTRLARTYVVTGDYRYRQQYETILRRRDGKEAHPQMPERIYWDYLAVENTDPPRPTGKMIALTQRMRDMGFTNAEMIKLDEAKNNSDGLVFTETMAMNTIQFNQKEKQTTKPSSTNEAISKMHDNEYHVNKLHIMKPVDNFFELLDQRTLSATQKALDKARNREYTIFALLIVSTLIIYITLILAYRALVRSQSLQLTAQKKIQKQADELTVSNDQLLIEIQKEEQRSEELAKAKIDAEVASQSKTDFLANMSHEIRTPMNGVIGMLHLLNKAELNKKQKEFVQMAKSSADSLLSLINDILDVSKIEAGKLEIESTAFNLYDIYRDTAQALAYQIHDKGIEFILDIQDLKHHSVIGDPSRIRQILTNLISNATKFTNNGEISVHARLCDIEDDPKHQQLYCEVRDTGIGISENQIAHLFDVFTQADSSTTRKYGGTGLGLSIIKQLCELMGGSVSVTSERDKGSCFCFELKLTRSDKVTKPIPYVDMAGVSILIVDDNRTNRIVLRNVLELKSIEVTSCSDGKECLNLLEESTNQSGKCPFEVAILDMQMPEMDGLSLARAIRSNPLYKDMSLVLMTSMGLKNEANEFAAIDFAAYLEKPALVQDLYDALSVILTENKTELLLTEHNIAVRREEEIITPENVKSLKPESRRILLAEDNPINQLVAQGILEEFGFSIDIANNGQEVIDILLQSESVTPYELILMDCQMPIMDGYLATSKIRRGVVGEHYINVPIVAMTANTMRGDKEKCIAVGMDDYIPKPVDPNDILRVLQDWLKKD